MTLALTVPFLLALPAQSPVQDWWRSLLPGGLHVPGAPRANRRPVIRTDLTVPLEVTPGQEVSFTVSVSDPDGDRVSLAFLNRAPGLEMSPLSAAPGEATSFRVRWQVPEDAPRRMSLGFRADDGKGDTGVVDLVATLLVSSRENVTILTEDVTGDGVRDVIAVAILADVGGVTNVGAVHVWAGGTSPSGTPSATLTVPGATQGDRLGLAGAQGIHAVDVTGDGTLDLVVGAERATVAGDANAGALYVFAGGPLLTGAVAPTATLSVVGGAPGDLLGNSGIFFEDVTADGLIDVVAGSPSAAPFGIPGSGALYVWEGGSGLTGTVAPSATLYVSAASPHDLLGIAGGEGVVLADVTGDGIADVVAGNAYADHSGLIDAGAVHVWEGGPGLTALSADVTVTLVADGTLAAQSGDLLGQSAGEGILLADVTGDGLRDVVAGAEFHDASAVNSGAVFLWAGGPTLSSNPNPTASLYVANGQAGDRVGRSAGQGVQLVDMTGDGLADVVAGAEFADDGSVRDTGAVFLWRSGSLSGSEGSPVELRGGGLAGDRLGFCEGQGVHLIDLTGDGLPEVVAGAQLGDTFPPLTSDVGYIAVWDGAPLSSVGGIQPPEQVLVAGTEAGNRLGSSSGQGILFGDVTGDGLPDLIAGTPFHDDGPQVDVGAVVVWEGGPTFVNGPVFWGELSGTFAFDRLGLAEGNGIQLADVSGDGILDIVAGAPQADSYLGIFDSGVVYVRTGGPFSVTRNLEPSSPGDGDRYGHTPGQGVRFVDLDDDGHLDVVAGSHFSSLSGSRVGRVAVWRGGPFLDDFEDASLEVSTPSANDQLGFASVGLLIADVTDDGVPDLLVGAQQADANSITNSGAVYLWEGGFGLFGSTFLETAVFADPSASPGDRLGAP